MLLFDSHLILNIEGFYSTADNYIDIESRQLCVWLIQGVACWIIFRKLFALTIWGVDSSQHKQCAESETPRIVDAGVIDSSYRQLPASLIKWEFPGNNSAGDSPYQRYAESAALHINDEGSRQIPFILKSGESIFDYKYLREFESQRL